MATVHNLLFKAAEKSQLKPQIPSKIKFRKANYIAIDWPNITAAKIA